MEPLNKNEKEQIYKKKSSKRWSGREMDRRGLITKTKELHNVSICMIQTFIILAPPVSWKIQNDESFLVE